MSKKTLLLVTILLMGIGIGVLSNTWINKKDNTHAPAYPGKTNTEAPTVKEPHEAIDQIEVLPILGTSDMLTAKQWQAMTVWRKETEQLAQQQKDIYINGPAGKKQVALTFDDGPDADITPQVLDILKEYQVPATFFLKGNQVSKYRSLVQRIQAQGCLAESHAYSHQELNKMNQADIKKELIATDQAFIKVIGRKPGLIRPPYGAINNNVLKAARSDKQAVVLWSIDTLDWSQQEPEHIAENVLTNVRPGDIILLHSREGQQATVQALPEIIKGLRLQGFTLVTAADLLDTAPYQSR